MQRSLTRTLAEAIVDNFGVNFVIHGFESKLYEGMYPLELKDICIFMYIVLLVFLSF